MTSPKKNDEQTNPDEPIAGGTVWSNQEGPDDDAFVEIGNGEVKDVRGPTPWLDYETDDDGIPEEVSIGLEGAEIEVGGNLAHGHYDFVSEEPKTVKKEYRTVTLGIKPPMVATVGDPTFHGSPLGPGTGSPDVFAQGKPVFRMFRDLVACSAATPAPHVGGVVLPMGPPPDVFVNGFPCARVGDAVMEILGGPNPILFNTTKTVFAGKPAPPVTTINPNPHIIETSEDKSWFEEYILDLEGEVYVDVDVLPTEATLGAGVAVDVDDVAAGGNLHLKASGEAIHGKAHARSELTIFGTWTVELFDQTVEGGAGKWKGNADVIADPVQKRISVDGDIDLGEEG